MTDPHTLLLQHAAPEIAADMTATYRSEQQRLGDDFEETVEPIILVISQLADHLKVPFLEAALFMLIEEEDDSPEDRDLHPMIKAATVHYLLTEREVF